MQGAVYMCDPKKCALCGKKTKLEMSHIVPKMVIRELKKGAAGKIRNTRDPNKTVQDSEKVELLCSECEDLFSKKETWFANNIFYPYLKKEKEEFSYNEKLTYFIVSVSWRSLYLDILDFVENTVVGIDALERLIKCEGIMRDFLLGKRSDLENIENHILFFGDVEYVSEGMTDLRPHAIFHRGICSYTITNEENKTYVTMTNMLGIMIFSIYAMGKDEQWENTKIERGNGTIKAGNQGMKSVVANEFERVMKYTNESCQNMSEAQQKKVIDRIKAKGNEIENSASYQAIKKDMALKEF